MRIREHDDAAHDDHHGHGPGRTSGHAHADDRAPDREHGPAYGPGNGSGHAHDAEHAEHAGHSGHAGHAEHAHDTGHAHEAGHQNEPPARRRRLFGGTRHGHGGHDHGGDAHAGHDHGIGADADRRYLRAALALLVGFLAVEVVVGIVADSLALLTDAGHMLTDAASIVLALFAMRLSARPASGRWTYGLKRAEILSAQVNGMTLLLLVAWFVYEAVHRLMSPPEVRGGLVLVTAVAGIGVNIAAAWLISRANRSSLNVEGAYQHILNDLWAFIATAVSGAVVLLTGFARADAIASLVVAALMLKAGLSLVSASWRILLEAAPAGIDPDKVLADLSAADSVAEVQDLHVWTITSGFPALSAHILVRPGLDCHGVREGLERMLRERYRIDHTTLQVDHVPVAAAGASGGGRARPCGQK